MLLKQSTAATVKLGPFVDSADAVTAETALTISQADIRLSKNGGDFAQTNNATGATHDESGYYDVPLDTTDTNTLGRLKVAVNESGALPVWAEYLVVPANVYDSLVSGSDQLQVDTTHVGGTSQTAGDLLAALNTIDDYVDELETRLPANLTAPTGAPSATPTIAAALAWLLTQARNKQTATADTQTLYADDASTPIATSALSDDGTTFTTGEWA